MALASEQAIDGFRYSAEFESEIVALHRGKEGLPRYREYLEDHLAGQRSRLRQFVGELLPEIRFHCGDLAEKRVLDCGCGTGATTVMLATESRRVAAFDIHERSLQICRRRVAEHGLSHRTTFHRADDVSELVGALGRFDLILLNGVLEHIPLSRVGLREHVFQTLFDALEPGGFLYVNDTPNRLWPIDRHTTRLWWIPWSRPGSSWAYRRAVRYGRHAENPETHSPGPLGLEERGAWGATYWELRRYLRGRDYAVVNTQPGHNRRSLYARRRGPARRVAEALIGPFCRAGGVPLAAFHRGLHHLVFQRRN